MKPMELFRRAIAEVGNVSAAELFEHLEKRHGVRIEPAFILLFKTLCKIWNGRTKFARTQNPFP